MESFLSNSVFLGAEGLSLDVVRLRGRTPAPGFRSAEDFVLQLLAAAAQRDSPFRIETCSPQAVGRVPAVHQ
ncbi:hypothetical protein FZ025_00540 [Xanthomonas hyacinthi]|nr:hypothetical protein FZ025_00540 [Xanthomonas hyacinthi]